MPVPSLTAEGKWCNIPVRAGVVESADTRDLKSLVRKDVRVQIPPPAPSIAANLDTQTGNPEISTVSGIFHLLEIH